MSALQDCIGPDGIVFTFDDFLYMEKSGLFNEFLHNFLEVTLPGLKDNPCVRYDVLVTEVLGIITKDYRTLVEFEHDARKLVTELLEKNCATTESFLFNDLKIRNSVLAVMFSRNNYDEDNIYSGLQILNSLTLPEDVIIWFDNVVTMLLKAISTIREEHIQEHGLVLLTKMVAYESSFKKKEIGNSGAIKILLEIIRNNLDQEVFNTVFLKSWKCLQLLIEEVPSNCKLFIKKGGLKCFFKCITTFHEDSEILHIAMDTILNVAQSKELRHRLIQDEYITVFSDLLLSTIYEIEISFKAACIIVCLFYDGNKTWPKRQELLDCITKASEIWKKADDAIIDCRFVSLDSILLVAQVKLVPQCTFWAAWTLANLTNKNPKQYCPIIIENGGLHIVRDLLNEPDETKLLAQQTIINCESFIKELCAVKPKRTVNNYTTNTQIFFQQMSEQYTYYGKIIYALALSNIQLNF